jgi:ABC-2 type transport system permease protein
MLTTVIPIARNALKESIRQPVFFVMLLLAAFIQLLNTWVVGFTMGPSNVPGEVTGDDKMLLDVSMGGIFLLGIMLAAFISTAAISREIENKTVLTVVSKPISRTSVILGKFLGISIAMLIAILIMIAYLLFGVRHGILSTAAEDPVWPVILFSVGSIFLSIVIGALGNYAYGWSFGQTAALTLLPLLWITYGLSLFIDEDWTLMEDPSENFKPQIMLACACLGMALLVMTSIATAISTRFGQVITIAFCAGIFLIGLLSNYWFGRDIFENQRFGQVAVTESPTSLDMYDFFNEQVWELAATRNNMEVEEFSEAGFDPRRYVTLAELLTFDQEPLKDDTFFNQVMLREPGSVIYITLLGPPREDIQIGDPVYYGASPSGVGMITPEFAPLQPGTPIEKDARDEPGLFIVDMDETRIALMQIGRDSVPLARPPFPGDSLFRQRTEVHPVPLAIWSVVPNMQSFWLLDAITQNQPIPLSHVFLVYAYGFCQIVVFLSLAVILFQGRDVG